MKYLLLIGPDGDVLGDGKITIHLRRIHFRRTHFSKREVWINSLQLQALARSSLAGQEAWTELACRSRGHRSLTGQTEPDRLGRDASDVVVGSHTYL